MGFENKDVGMMLLGAIFILAAMVETLLTVRLKWPTHWFFHAIMLSEFGLAFAAIGYFERDLAGISVASVFLAAAVWSWFSRQKHLRDWQAGFGSGSQSVK